MAYALHRQEALPPLPMNNPWIDLSLPIHENMPTWPDNPEVTLKREQCLQHGDVCNVSRLQLGTHTGTHVDGLNHFIEGAPGIDKMPLELMTGTARVIEISNPDQITAQELDAHDLRAGERILFRTQNSDRLHQKNSFQKDFVHIAEDAARLLASAKVALIGVDYLSVGGYEGNVIPVHEALLGAGIWCVEGLNLKELSAGSHEFICLPIRLVDGDGGLARAIARRIQK